MALGWPLLPSGDAPESFWSRYFRDAPEMVGSATSIGSGSQSAGSEAAEEGEALELSGNREHRSSGRAIDRIQWRNAPDADGDTDTAVRGFSKRRSSEKESLYAADTIKLDPLVLVEGVETVRLSGEDPLAPRDLIAWRDRGGGQLSLLVRGWSDEEGALHFPKVIRPQNGLEVLITDASSTPDDPGSSVTQSLPGRMPVAAQARQIAFSEGEFRLRIAPVEGVGSVLLADADGTIFGVYEVAPTSVRTERVFHVDVSSPNPFIFIGHEFSDGRTSSWQVVDLEIPDSAAAGS
jgi:hypothetical protein